MVKDFDITDIAVVVLLRLPVRVTADRARKAVGFCVEVVSPLGGGDFRGQRFLQ